MLSQAAPPVLHREAAWKRLGEEVFDVLVIGGGINGAAIARDAVLRGMSVALVDTRDFASGTSSKSSKLIHGGVRYLEYGEIGLVLEACRERDLLRTRLAPHLVRAQPFVFPIYDDDSLTLWRLRAGLLLYDILAAFRNVENHKILSPAAVNETEPALLSQGLCGGALYYDCWTDDARLTLETLLAARTAGAAALNYASVVALEKDSAGRLATAHVTDMLSGATQPVRARCFVNVSGPWLDHIRRLDDAGAPPRLKLTKGVHIVVDREKVGNRNAVVIRGASDNRVMFVIPWQRQTLVGTTDTYFEGDPATVRADADDIDYILATVNRAFPSAGLKSGDIISAYAGLRPLVAPEDELDESAVSRDDQIFESPAGLLSLGGGKLTTHRHVAERMVNRVSHRIGRRVGRCRTRTVPLPAASGCPPGGVLYDDHSSTEEHVRARYGALGHELSTMVGEDESLGLRLVDDRPDIKAEVVYAVDHEMAVTVDDILSRRLQVALRSRALPERVARDTASLVADHLKWGEEDVESQVSDYVDSVGGTAAKQAGAAGRTSRVKS